MVRGVETPAWTSICGPHWAGTGQCPLWLFHT